MRTTICTLFEGHYHNGVAALANSLYFHGYRGAIYIGYKGALPLWAHIAKENCSLRWKGSKTFELATGFKLHFLPLETEYHLTNYKPEFISLLWDGPAKDAEAIAYFDPDIVIKCPWKFFDSWMSHGVALVREIANDPMPFSHPIRLGWKEVMEKCNRNTKRKLNHYYNGGFCGIKKDNIEFITTWSQVLDTAVKFFNFQPNQAVTSTDRTYHFQASDQDALNIAAMCSISPISEVGPDGMDFTPGGWIMSHAVGSVKPWNKNFILSSLRGIKPTRADRAYWQYANGLISNYSKIEIKLKNFAISLAAMIGRFYSRS